MSSRRVPVLRLGSRGPGGDARSLRLCSQAFAIVRRVSDLRRTCRERKSSRNAELSSLFAFRNTKVSTVTGIGGVVVAKPKTVVTFGRVLRLRVSNVSAVIGIGRVVVAKPKTVVTFGLVLRLRVSTVSTVIGIGRVVVAQRRTVVTLDSSCVFAPQQCQQSQGGRGRETQNCRHFWTRLSREEGREERDQKREMRGERREERGEKESG